MSIVRRDINGNKYVRLKDSTQSDCQEYLKRMAEMWREVQNVPLTDPYEVELGDDYLEVRQGNLVVYRYVVETDS